MKGNSTAESFYVAVGAGFAFIADAWASTFRLLVSNDSIRSVDKERRLTKVVNWGVP